MDDFSEKCRALGNQIIELCEGIDKEVVIVTVYGVFGSLCKVCDQTRASAHVMLDSILDDVEIN